MKITVAIDSLKGSLASMEAGNAAKGGILRVYPEAEVFVRPLADGVKDQFSDTVGGSAEWIAFRSSQERKSGGSSHLDHRKRFALSR